MLNHNYIGTEHILLGLIHEGEGVAAKSLESLGLSLDGIRSQVEEIIGTGEQAPSGHIPFTPRAKKVLELSLREALQLGHNYIGTEHILLGLIREGEGVGSRVLVQLGAELTRVRQQVIQILGGYQGLETGRGVAPKTYPRPRTSREQVLMAKIREVRKRKENLIDSQDFVAASEARDEEKALVKEYSELRKTKIAPPRTEGQHAISEVLKLSDLLNTHNINPTPELMTSLFEWRVTPQ